MIEGRSNDKKLNLHFYDQNYILSAAYKINDNIKDCHVH